MDRQMAMKQIKVSEATGLVLDWLVAKCEGTLPASYDEWAQTWPRYSTDWAQGGPIIEREDINTWRCVFCDVSESGREIYRMDGWKARTTTLTHWDTPVCADGPTRLIAEMRCYVVSKLGETVEVPEELV